MGSVTGKFQSETPLHPAAQACLTDSFSRGWAEPGKIHRDSRQVNILLNEAKEVFAARLGIRHDQVEFLSDPALGFHLGISGLLEGDSHLYFSAVDRSEVFAVAELHQNTKLPVGLDGLTAYPEGNPQDVLAWQSANGETGAISNSPGQFAGNIFVDAMASGLHRPLPDRWHTALWNSRSWKGPAGLGVFAVSDKGSWRNPLPHVDQRISSIDFSIPLVLASAVALDAYADEYQEKLQSITGYNEQIRAFLRDEIGDVDIASDIANSLPHLLSFSILYTDAQFLVSELDRRGFALDSGSACNSTNMEPSHVLAAMGLLTHGNLRMNLSNIVGPAEVTEFLATLKELVLEARR